MATNYVYLHLTTDYQHPKCSKAYQFTDAGVVLEYEKALEPVFKNLHLGGNQRVMTTVTGNLHVECVTDNVHSTLKLDVAAIVEANNSFVEVSLLRVAPNKIDFVKRRHSACLAAYTEFVRIQAALDDGS